MELPVVDPAEYGRADAGAAFYVAELEPGGEPGAAQAGSNGQRIRRLVHRVVDRIGVDSRSVNTTIRSARGQRGGVPLCLLRAVRRATVQRRSRCRGLSSSLR